MRTPRLRVDADLAADGELELTAERAHYLLRVLRRGVGDAVQLFDGRGTRVDARITATHRGTARLALEPGTRAHTPAPRHPIHLALALTKGDTLDDVLHAATELGVDAIALLECARSEGRLPAEPERAARRIAHWRGILDAACEQSGRDTVPVLDPPRPFPAWLERNAAPCWLLHPGATRRIDAGMPLPDGPLVLAIGPEGGWSEDERRAATRAGCLELELPTAVLRARTAPLAALAMLALMRRA